MILYLAHPWPTRKRIREWQKKIEARTGVTFVNPFYDLDNEDMVAVDSGKQGKYDTDPKKIVEGDLKAMRKCDGILAIVDGSLSYGTIMEIVYAYRFGLPVYLMVSNKHEKHQWFRYHATEIFLTLERFARWLKKEMKKKKNQ